MTCRTKVLTSLCVWSQSFQAFLIRHLRPNSSDEDLSNVSNVKKTNLFVSKRTVQFSWKRDSFCELLVFYMSARLICVLVCSCRFEKSTETQRHAASHIRIFLFSHKQTLSNFESFGLIRTEGKCPSGTIAWKIDRNVVLWNGLLLTGHTSNSWHVLCDGHNCCYRGGSLRSLLSPLWAIWCLIGILSFKSHDPHVE